MNEELIEEVIGPKRKTIRKLPMLSEDLNND